MEKIFSVSEFNEFLNTYLGEMGEVVIEGEISRIDLSQGKWIYGTINDVSGCVQLFSVKELIYNFTQLQPGMLVHIYGKPRIYAKSGRFSVFVNRIVPAGEGALQIAFEKLKSSLEQEGLFNLDRKRTLPPFPSVIGLITAENSQAYSDFIKILSERMGGICIKFFPVQVQGKDSVESIVSAFHYFNSTQTVDAIVLCRGGGSLEDLQSFNDEKVARAIYSSKAPVVCGVGHEQDISIADLVADVRASTPSNAAELLVADRQAVMHNVWYKLGEIEGDIFGQLHQQQNRIRVLTHFLQQSMSSTMTKVHSGIDALHRCFITFSNAVRLQHYQSAFQTDKLQSGAHIWLNREKNHIDHILRLLKSMDYREILKRGFSLTSDSNGRIIKSAQDVVIHSHIVTTLASGTIHSEIKTVEVENHDR